MYKGGEDIIKRQIGLRLVATVKLRNITWRKCLFPFDDLKKLIKTNKIVQDYKTSLQ